MAGPGVDDPGTDPWAAVRAELEADVRRVSDRLRTPVGDPPGQPSGAAGAGLAAVRVPGPGRRAAALELARAAARAARRPPPGPAASRATSRRCLDLAVGDQVAVTGHDLLAAMDLVSARTRLVVDGQRSSTGAGRRGRRATPPRSLADVRRRL